ncbi:SDR family NAD(P)-dependent oxidoreductase [Ferrovibrio sp.]|uniref:SDR family NAD(P)-dependent oxidoreductase n=1 Tax=Ferrovibrio sp. TaxID=1917215 RepID=UPI0035163259
MPRLANKVALITGAASGFGRATAELFVREGARVILTDRQVESGIAAADRLGDGARFAPLDVTQEDQWAAVVAGVKAAEGRLDILVNNAGIGLFRDLTEMTLAEWRLVQAVNSDGVFLGCKHAIPLMRDSVQGRRGGGSIVNIASVAGLVGAPQMSAYCASKGAATMLTKALAMEAAHGRWNIRVNSVHPAYVETALVKAHIAQSPEPEKTRRFLERLQPVGRMGTVDEVAQAILYLASDESSFTTGAELVVDGGMTAQ